MSPNIRNGYGRLEDIVAARESEHQEEDRQRAITWDMFSHLYATVWIQGRGPRAD